AMAAASGNGKIAGGIAAGTAGSAIGTFLAHTRAEETTADQIGARYMMRAGSDASAALDVLEIFRGQEALSVSRQDAYARTHPLSAERIRALKGAIAAYGGARRVAVSRALKYRHARMVAKFRGFLGNPSYTLRHMPKSDRSQAAMMTRAIAHHRQGRAKEAVAIMNGLIAKNPNDPYYHELKGQILLEGRMAGPGVTAYRRAVALAPGEPLILAGLGRALLSLRTSAGDRKALDTLRRARAIDGRDSRMLRDLAVAWAKTGNNGMASLVTAERYALLARFKDARTNATRAEGLLPRGSAGWLKAQDIIAAADTFLKD
ncbi:MAG: M48 family metalloprotease, partial [Paracoccaceae bacterium]